MGQPVTTSAPAERAFELEREIVTGCHAIRTAWIGLAQRLHDFHAEKLWTSLGHETFNDWLGEPELGLSRSHALGLIAVHRELVVERGVDPERLIDLDVTKAREVLPAIRRGADVDEALSDCAALSRSDLRTKYREGEKPIMRRCPACGSNYRVSEDA